MPAQTTAARQGDMGANDIDVAKLSLSPLGELGSGGDFDCSDQEFADHLRAGAAYDMKVQMGLTYRTRHDKQVVGFMTLAMAHLDRAEQRTPGIDAYGNMPVLL